MVTDPATGTINLAREDIVDSNFSIRNYSVISLFKRWIDHVNFFNPKDFHSKR